MTLRDNLIAAKGLIDEPEKWTQDVSARGKSGREVSLFGYYAVCFCITGAIDRLRAREIVTILELSLPSAFEGDLVDYNDHPDTTHADIMALFDRAIEAAE